MSESPAAAAPTAAHLGRAMAVGSAWMVAGRWLLRGIGLVSTVILARLLAPADFGLIASAMLVIGALQVLTETGQRAAIVRMRDPQRAHYDSAWTMGLLIGFGVAGALAILAPFIAGWFHDPRLSWIVWALALRPAIQSFENIGLIDLQRRLDFRRDLQIMLVGKLAGFAVTVTLAFALRNYWALIAGTLAQAVTGVVVSYALLSFRPRLSFSKTRELWSFSLWTLVTHICAYGAGRADHVGVASRLGSEAMGVYTVGAELAALPTEELIVPPVRALYAVYSRVSHDPAAMQAHYLTALSFLAIVACATSTGVALVADDAVAVVLGARWTAAAPVLPWIALASGVMGVSQSVLPVLLAAGHARANAVRTFAFAVLLLLAGLAGAGWRDVEGVAIARLAITIIFVPIMFAPLVRLLNIPIAAIWRVVWRPVVAAGVMAVAVAAMHPYLPAIPWLRLLGDAMLGASTYVAVLWLLWLCAGRPGGAERTLLIWLLRRGKPSH